MVWDVVSGAQSASTLGMPGGGIHRALFFYVDHASFFQKTNGRWFDHQTFTSEKSECKGKCYFGHKTSESSYRILQWSLESTRKVQLHLRSKWINSPCPPPPQTLPSSSAEQVCDPFLLLAWFATFLLANECSWHNGLQTKRHIQLCLCADCNEKASYSILSKSFVTCEFFSIQLSQTSFN